MHAHPDVLPHVIEFAEHYGACGIRVPRDPFWLNMITSHSNLPTKIVSGLGARYLVSVCGKRLRKSGLIQCNYSIGTLMSGKMTSDYVIRMLRAIRASSIEIYFHPSCSSQIHSLGPNEGDLNALLCPKLKSFVQHNGFNLTTYPELKRLIPEGNRADR
jgi:hypothetical protein